MRRTTATMMGAAAALATGPAMASAATTDAPAVPVASSYAELLQPIPNAVERLKLADAEEAARPARLIEAQYVPGAVAHHHHHHHHTHYYSRRWYLQHGYYWYGGRWVLRPVRRYHHHHNNY